MDPEMLAEGRAIARKLKQARQRWEDARESAKDWTQRAYDAGATETEMGKILGVDRANTIRPWLGKGR
jgi:hypothetical protein